MEGNLPARIVRWLVVLAIPLFLTVGTVRLLIAWDSPSYPEFEYDRIPPDPYGFTLQERLDLAAATLDYLRRPQPATEVIHLLEALRLPGTDQSLYNQREIDHMIDVKVVADAFVRVMWISFLVMAAGLIFLLARPDTRWDGAKALWQGGILTVILVVVVMLFIGAAWSVAFTLFHDLFFPPGTWTFSYRDSLIRLFPEQFWFDFGLLWTGIILLAGALIALVGYVLRRRLIPSLESRAPVAGEAGAT